MNGAIEYSVGFRIIDDNLDPAEITKMLGIVPDDAHRKGEPNTKITPKGKILHYAPFNTGIWIVNSHEERHEILARHIKSLLDILYPLKDKLAELTSRGYKMDIFCGAFLNEVQQPGFDISPDILLQMGEMNIKIGMCIYP
ncbi:MAG: DUF4279 domain-containing protein [Defluviitaleaceae bacterium]|nr:DUF4279 domain-containing protein [Defluviitaleaceae bacterium]